MFSCFKFKGEEQNLGVYKEYLTTKLMLFRKNRINSLTTKTSFVTDKSDSESEGQWHLIHTEL